MQGLVWIKKKTPTKSDRIKIENHSTRVNRGKMQETELKSDKCHIDDS